MRDTHYTKRSERAEKTNNNNKANNRGKYRGKPSGIRKKARKSERTTANKSKLDEKEKRRK